MKKVHDVIIVGAGPAGLRCAKILAENNVNFLLLEKKPKLDRKICTGVWGLTKKTKYMGLPDKLFEKKFKKATFSTPHKKIELKLKKPFVATLNRKKLSEWMYKEAKKSGANIVFNSPVSKIGENYIIAKGKKIYFKNLVGADGSTSIVRKSLRLPQSITIAIQYWTKQKFKNMEIHFDVNKFGAWYAWITPHKKLTSIGTGCDLRFISSKKMKKNLDLWCSENNFNISNAKFEGAPINYDYQGYKFKNKFLIGDAGGFTSGWTGEGMYFAMASGEDVAKLIINKKHSPQLINQILDIKKKHEEILKFLELGKIFEKAGHSILLSLLKFKFFDKEFIDLVA